MPIYGSFSYNFFLISFEFQYLPVVCVTNAIDHILDIL